MKARVPFQRTPPGAPTHAAVPRGGAASFLDHRKGAAEAKILVDGVRNSSRVLQQQALIANLGSRRPAVTRGEPPQGMFGERMRPQGLSQDAPSGPGPALQAEHASAVQLKLQVKGGTADGRAASGMAERSGESTAAAPAVQRWYQRPVGEYRLVENNQPPVGYVHLQGRWRRVTPQEAQDDEYVFGIQDEITEPRDTAEWNDLRVFLYNRSLDDFFVQGDIKNVNDTQYKSTGCAWFVAADILNTSGNGLLGKVKSGHLMEDGEIEKLFVRGDTNNIQIAIKLLESVVPAVGRGVSKSAPFANMVTFLQWIDQRKDYAWDGAIAWEGHIVRGSAIGHHVRFWDPQGGQESNRLMPMNTYLAVWTLQ